MIFEFAINVLFIWGLYYSFLSGEVFGGIGGVITRALGEYANFNKPFYGCVICMGSVWSIPFYAHSVIEHDYSLIYWPVYCFSLVGTNYLIVRILK